MLRPCNTCPLEHFISIWHAAPTNHPLKVNSVSVPHIYVSFPLFPSRAILLRSPHSVPIFIPDDFIIILLAPRFYIFQLWPYKTKPNPRYGTETPAVPQKKPSAVLSPFPPAQPNFPTQHFSNTPKKTVGWRVECFCCSPENWEGTTSLKIHVPYLAHILCCFSFLTALFTLARSTSMDGKTLHLEEMESRYYFQKNKEKEKKTFLIPSTLGLSSLKLNEETESPLSSLRQVWQLQGLNSDKLLTFCNSENC